MTVEELRARIRARMAAKRAEEKPATGPAPRYDEVYFEGMAWLDRMARGEDECDSES